MGFVVKFAMFITIALIAITLWGLRIQGADPVPLAGEVIDVRGSQTGDLIIWCVLIKDLDRFPQSHRICNDSVPFPYPEVGEWFDATAWINSP